MTKKQYELLFFEFCVEHGLRMEYYYGTVDIKINVFSYPPHRWMLLISDITKTYGWSVSSRQALDANGEWIALINSHGYNTGNFGYVEDSMRAIDNLLERM